MPAVASATTPNRPLSAPAFVHAPERRCPYCCTGLPREAKKCAACAEWVVGTSAGVAAAFLRLLGWAWGGASLLVAAALWYGGNMVRVWLVARAVDPVFTPVLLSAFLYTLVGFVVLQGLTIGVGLGVVARIAPRRPRWWT
jgi:hypothetical protein